MDTHAHIIYITLHVLLVATLICVLYFTLVLPLEKQIVNNQAEYLMNEMTKDFELVPSEYKKALGGYISWVKNDIDMKEADNAVKEINKGILKQVLISGFIFFVLCLGLVAYCNSKTKDNIDYIDLSKRLCVVLLFVGATEYMFMRFLSSPYLYADPNFVKKNIYESVLKI